MTIQTLSEEEVSMVSGGAIGGPLGSLLNGLLGNKLVLGFASDTVAVLGDIVDSKPVQGLLNATLPVVSKLLTVLHI